VFGPVAGPGGRGGWFGLWGKRPRRSVMAPSLPLRADGVPGAMRRLRRALARLAAAALGRPHAAARAGRIDLSGRLACLSFTEVGGGLAASRRGGTLTLRAPRGRGGGPLHRRAVRAPRFRPTARPGPSRAVAR